MVSGSWTVSASQALPPGGGEVELRRIEKERPALMMVGHSTTGPVGYFRWTVRLSGPFQAAVCLDSSEAGLVRISTLKTALRAMTAKRPSRRAAGGRTECGAEGLTMRLRVVRWQQIGWDRL